MEEAEEKRVLAIRNVAWSVSKNSTSSLIYKLDQETFYFVSWHYCLPRFEKASFLAFLEVVFSSIISNFLTYFLRRYITSLGLLSSQT